MTRETGKVRPARLVLLLERELLALTAVTGSSDHEHR